MDSVSGSLHGMDIVGMASFTQIECVLLGEVPFMNIGMFNITNMYVLLVCLEQSSSDLFTLMTSKFPVIQ